MVEAPVYGASTLSHAEMTPEGAPSGVMLGFFPDLCQIGPKYGAMSFRTYSEKDCTMSNPRSEGMFNVEVHPGYTALQSPVQVKPGATVRDALVAAGLEPVWKHIYRICLDFEEVRLETPLPESGDLFVILMEMVT